jgi:hypothetical protein
MDAECTYWFPWTGCLAVIWGTMVVWTGWGPAIVALPSPGRILKMSTKIFVFVWRMCARHMVAMAMAIPDALALVVYEPPAAEAEDALALALYEPLTADEEEEEEAEVIFLPILEPPAWDPLIGPLECHHGRVTRRGSNMFVLRRSCLWCGRVLLVLPRIQLIVGAGENVE